MIRTNKDQKTVVIQQHPTKEKIIKSKNAICIVLTAEKSILTRGVAVWDTWGPGKINLKI